MDNTIYGNIANRTIGIPYKNIRWEDIPGQPFGIASQFNLFVFGDANNIVDVEGAMAVGGSFYTKRSLSIGFQRKNGEVPIPFSPDLVRFLIGNIVSTKGPLVVIGHAVAGGSYRLGLGSTYYIGKDNLNGDQLEELKKLYYANNGSIYWTPSDKGEYYLIPSYDVPRIIPASRIFANIAAFFADARRSIESFYNCIIGLNSTGMVTSNSYEWILTGTNPVQNIFTIDVRKNGLLNKGIRFNIPDGSLGIVRLKTGPHAHLQYGLYGAENLANHILYVFEDATDIHMEKSSDIWGSILAPHSMFHGHPTGGRVSGNAVLGGFAVNENSGFEFHLYPFVGGVVCPENVVLPEIIPVPVEIPVPEVIIPAPVEAPVPVVVPIPVETPVPEVIIPSPVETPVPEIIPMPVETPVPVVIPRPVEIPVPVETPMPEVIPVPVDISIIFPEAPASPTVIQCPECPTCPVIPECPTCPVIPECPTCPVCSECPTCPVCPECPKCPEKETEYIAVPVPVPVKTETNVAIIPICEKCFVVAGIIIGCVVGCECCRNHEWDIMLYQVGCNEKILIDCVTIYHLGYFRFEVEYEGDYILKICPVKRNCFSFSCKPKVTFKNIGVANLTLE